MKLIHDIFIEVGKTVIDKLGVSTSQQRLDSTHIESNVRYRGRITLFQDTLHLFLKKLCDSHYQQVPDPIRQWHEAQPSGWFGLGGNEKRARGCSPRNTVGNFRLEITRELRLRDAMFEQQKTRQWKERYKIRSGVEATMSELKRLGMGRLRVRGLVKVIFAVSCKVIACNIKRWYKAVILADPCQNPQNDPGNATNSIFCALDGFIFTILVPIWVCSCIISIANKPYMYGINNV